jgi:predicted phage-related endonuclease
MKVKDALIPEFDVQYGEFDVSQDRDKFIGGSDLPIICGVSKFKTRWQLLLEKAGLAENDFSGNRYTEYGHVLEPKIREHINMAYSTTFVPNRVINGDLRMHTDGFDGECVLEIKTTSDIHTTVLGYRTYLIQLVKYMEQNEVENGLLAVYHRPENLSTEFDLDRLQVFKVRMEDHKALLEYVNKEIDRFRRDLERLKDDPLLCESDFIPASTDMVALAKQIEKFEKQLATMKEIEQQLKDAKKKLYDQMLKHNVKSCNLPNGMKVTRVDEVPGSTKKVREFDSKRFKADHPNLYSQYETVTEKTSSGRSGYVRIS